MADLRSRFLEDYAGGLLNVARQELSSTGEVLAQDGFSSDLTLFVEDGRGVKSGLRLGAGLVECIDPVSETGAVNVRFADRTYAKIKDLKIFATAISTSQAALSDSVSSSFGEFESSFFALENDLQDYKNQLTLLVSETSTANQTLTERVEGAEESVVRVNDRVDELKVKVDQLAVVQPTPEKQEQVDSFTTANLSPDSFSLFELGLGKLYGLTSIATNSPAWVTFYSTEGDRAEDARTVPGPGPGIILDLVTEVGSLRKQLPALVVGFAQTNLTYARIVNTSDISSPVGLEVRYVRF